MVEVFYVCVCEKGYRMWGQGREIELCGKSTVWFNWGLGESE